ncbi:MAG: iron ABC transporter [Candidatus Glassbacteria bacterium RIFCSPLOWO2_12_FULL_58_11]|uniref:Iron ABC transporter n=1 Tax=Candidatus Glassbacteria bacterium RIFCSPLOWO2_12_FULL_58_11 TaxID=1817867 RepID=A0A1F5YTF0_9BACT|nr:MAG: iron ABC transporter [Candidatus Glassbacteria bacterium RIFCSPLOWO2_12_FULL_58_11]
MIKSWTLPALVAFSILTVAAAPLVGPHWIPPEAILKPVKGVFESDLFWKIRLPRVCTSFLAGSALAVAGLAFQAIFRNALATPFTLGVSSGASLGATLYVGLGFTFSILGFPGDVLASFAGALLSVGLVYYLSRLKKGFSTSSMLLAGVAVSFFFSSLILLVQYMSDFTKSFQILRRLIGGIQVVGFEEALNLLPFVVAGVAVVAGLSHELNLLTVGEDIATSRGVNVNRTKKVLFLFTSLMVGGVVAFCGPIGFVGMMVPHIVRLFLGADHRYLTPGTLAFGGGFLTLCDTLSRTVLSPVELPVGVITAILGGPFFIWLLLSNSSDRSFF